MITLRQVEAFRAVMISGSVTQAANMLFVSQPAVSRILSVLEYRVGFKLFDRTRRHLVPTEEGRAFYDEVERAFTGLQQIDQAAASIRRYHRGHLRLITFQSLAPTLMVDLITRFAERYPEIAVSLEVQPSQRVFERVVSQHCDLGILTAPITGASVVASTIATTNAVCILPKSHRLAASDRIDLKEIADDPMILLDLPKSGEYYLSLFDIAQISPKIAHRTTSPEVARVMVAHGLGYSILAMPTRHTFAIDGTEFAVKPLAGALPNLCVGMLATTETASSHTYDCVRKVAKTALAQLLLPS